MSVSSIKVSMKENPMDIIKGCTCLLGELDTGFTEHIYSHHAITVISDLLHDAVRSIEEESKSNERDNKNQTK